MLHVLELVHFMGPHFHVIMGGGGGAENYYHAPLVGWGWGGGGRDREGEAAENEVQLFYY